MILMHTCHCRPKGHLISRYSHSFDFVNIYCPHYFTQDSTKKEKATSEILLLFYKFRSTNLLRWNLQSSKFNAASWKNDLLSRIGEFQKNRDFEIFEK